MVTKTQCQAKVDKLYKLIDTFRKYSSPKKASATTGKGRRRTAYIEDNGGTPFIVDVFGGKKVVVYESEWDDDNSDPEKGPEILTLDAIKVFFPKAPPNFEEDGYAFREGNSLLVQVDEKEYVSIGWNIHKFKIPEDDTIVHYYSPIGNSAVPYPYAVGKKYVYLMLTEGGRKKAAYVPALLNSELKEYDEDPYRVFYEKRTNKVRVKELKSVELVARRD